jgi:peptide/nickel transport system substrate-binding protein
MKNRAGIWTAILCVAILAGCNRPPTAPTTVTLRLESEPENLNPLLRTSAVAQRLIGGANNSNIYESLEQWDTKDWSTTVGLLAKSRPEISEDHLRYTYSLRDGIKWHDGTALTADDVYFTFKAAICPLVDAAGARSYLSELVNVELLGQGQVRFTIRKPYFLNEAALGIYIPIIPKHVFDPRGLLDSVQFAEMIGAVGRGNANVQRFAEEFNKHPANRAPVGSGPYKMRQWDTGKEIILIKNDSYWGKRPTIDTIVYRIITDSTVALSALKSGEIDFNPRLAAVQFAQQTDGPSFDGKLVKASYTTPGYSYIGWNEERPFFRDVRVRQALTMLVNRKQLIDQLRFGLGRIGVSPFSPGISDFNTALTAWPYDPEKAKQLLTEAGWVDHDGDGIRDKDGVPFRFEMLGAAGSQSSMQIMTLLRDEFSKVGIEMKERQLEFSVFVNARLDHRADAAIAQWAGDLVQDPYQVWHSDSIANRGSNWISFRNADADQLIDQARTEFDSTKRRALYWKLQEIIHEQQPYTFLYYPQDAAAYNSRIRNVQFLPAPPGYDVAAWRIQ